jgi:hypothetical protein
VKSISITNGDTSVSIPVASTGNSSNKFSISVDGTSHAGALPPKSTYQIRLTDSSKIAPK